MTRDTICIIIIILALAVFFQLSGRHEANKPDHVASPEIKRIMAYHGIDSMVIPERGRAYFERNGQKIYVNINDQGGRHVKRIQK